MMAEATVRMSERIFHGRIQIVSWNVGEGPAITLHTLGRQLNVFRGSFLGGSGLKAPLDETLIATLSYRLWTKVRPRAIFNLLHRCPGHGGVRLQRCCR